jgi:hypothetical protein
MVDLVELITRVKATATIAHRGEEAVLLSRPPQLASARRRQGIRNNSTMSSANACRPCANVGGRVVARWSSLAMRYSIIQERLLK